MQKRFKSSKACRSDTDTKIYHKPTIQNCIPNIWKATTEINNFEQTHSSNNEGGEGVKWRSTNQICYRNKWRTLDWNSIKRFKGSVRIFVQKVITVRQIFTGWWVRIAYWTRNAYSIDARGAAGFVCLIVIVHVERVDEQFHIISWFRGGRGSCE